MEVYAVFSWVISVPIALSPLARSEILLKVHGHVFDNIFMGPLTDKIIDGN